MIAIALITLRESLEILLVGGALYSALIEHRIDKKRELIAGASVAAFLSLCTFILVSFVGSRIHFKLDHELGEILEKVNYLGTGFFLLLTATLLHNAMKRISAHSSSYILNTSVFAIGFLLVLREGVEIIFFSIPSSISSVFISSLLGLLLGLICTGIVGIISSRFIHSQFTHRNILIYSDWAIKILSLYFILMGIVGLAELIL